MQKVKSLNEKIINIVLIYSLVKSKKAPNQIKNSTYNNLLNLKIRTKEF